jgi:hypothetical protein
MSARRTPSGWVREIVAQRALIVGAVTGVVHLVVVLFALPPDLESSVPAVVGAAIDLIGTAVLVVWARRGVTPANPDLAPRSDDGQAFVIRSNK